MRSSTAELVRPPETLIVSCMKVKPSPGEQTHQGSGVLPGRHLNLTPGARCRHDADPVINPLADRAEVLGLGRVVPARLLDARLGRHQLQPQRGNLGCRVRSAIFVSEAAR